jgi:SAF domain
MALESYSVEAESGPSRSFFLTLVGVVGVIVVAALLVSHIRGEGEVVVAKREIPAFSRLDEDDLRTVSVDKQGREVSSATADELVDKYTREALAEGQELDGEDVIDGGPHGIGAVRIQLHPDQADALDLTAGEEVRLWLSPGEEAGVGLIISARLLEIPEVDSPADQTYVVGLSKRDAYRLIDRLGRSRLLITRPGAVVPSPKRPAKGAGGHG